MSIVTPETVRYVAGLARLTLTEDETVTFARQLEQILDYAQILGSLDTDGVPPMSQAVLVEAFREDEPRPGLPLEAVMASAPDSSDRLFRVPKVIG